VGHAAKPPVPVDLIQRGIAAAVAIGIVSGGFSSTRATRYEVSGVTLRGISRRGPANAVNHGY
jgi:hypothetical protein